MLKKDSPPKLLIPSLVKKYQNATKRIYGIFPFVAENDYSKFIVLADDLRDKDIDGSEYANAVLLLLKSFIEKKKMKFVPVNMFCGTYAWNVYMKSKEMKTVDISNKEDIDILLHDELIVARCYIEHGKDIWGFVRFEQVVKELKPMLSKQWLRCYHMSLNRPVDKAMEILRDEYKKPKAKTYLDLMKM